MKKEYDYIDESTEMTSEMWEFLLKDMKKVALSDENQDYLLKVYAHEYGIAKVNQNIKTKVLANGESVLIVDPKTIDDLEVGMKPLQKS